VGVFLQARLGSTRLPRKALLPLAGTTVLQLTMRALARVEAGGARAADRAGQRQ
jgi:spore coat polysaccharide biosynthesis protein SpsF (cytidylyltransferase family)